MAFGKAKLLQVMARIVLSVVQRNQEPVSVQKNMNMSSPHIQVEKLADLAANRLALDEAKELRSHLIACSTCTEHFARFAQYVGQEPSNGEEEAGSKFVSPEVSQTKLKAEPNPNGIQRVIALLTFDSKQLSPAFGIRSGVSVARQLLFSIGELDLDLRIAPDDGAWIVSGQVLGECLSGHVDLCGENVAERAAMNDLCEFSLPRVPPGKYSLLVHISDQDIEVPEFELRA